MKNLITKAFGIAGIVGASFLPMESLGQKMSCDTIYKNKKEIEKVILHGEYSFSIINFKDGKQFSEDYFGYENNKLSFYRKTELDDFGRTVIKEDFNGDGTINIMFIEDKEKKITLIDENNDGIFDVIWPSSEYFYERCGNKKDSVKTPNYNLQK